MDEQVRLTDLIPRRLVAFAVLFALGVGVIAGLEFLYAQMPRLGKFAADGKLVTIDLDGPGSLATWFSSTCLTLAGLIALLAYTVRRHRFDDYSGHYRIWFWAAACCFLLSFDATASLHQSFAQIMSVVTGTKIYGDGSLWWVIPYCFLFGAVGLRLLIDMSECWMSSLALVGAAASYAASAACKFGMAEWVPLSTLRLSEANLRQAMLENGARLLGDLLVLTAMGLHARYVILDSEGLISRRRSRSGRRWIWARRSRPAVVETDLGPRVVQVGRYGLHTGPGGNQRSRYRPWRASPDPACRRDSYGRPFDD